MKKVLLHICCGICASGAIQRLQADGFEVVGFFYNPNIHPMEEYERRLAAARDAAKIIGIKLLQGEYDAETWDAAVKGRTQEPEGGSRCEVCFRMRLERTHQKANDEGIACFATTLTISPHKDAALINRLGPEIGGRNFLVYDFKKQDGFKKSNTFSKEHRLYRQDYCGCRYSTRHEII